MAVLRPDRQGPTGKLEGVRMRITPGANIAGPLIVLGLGCWRAYDADRRRWRDR